MKCEVSERISISPSQETLAIDVLGFNPPRVPVEIFNWFPGHTHAFEASTRPAQARNSKLKVAHRVELVPALERQFRSSNQTNRLIRNHIVTITPFSRYDGPL